MNDIVSTDKEAQLRQLAAAGREIRDFLKNHSENQYILIIEGQASKDNFLYNYELSYQRALALMRFWIEDSRITFGSNCEILISGSGDGKLDTHSMRETNDERENQRFLIHILPKTFLKTMKINNFIISTVSIICLYSCAHKSGHGERNDKIVTSQQSQSVLVSPNKKARNVTISVVNNRGDKNKLDGSQIFRNIIRQFLWCLLRMATICTKVLDSLSTKMVWLSAIIMCSKELALVRKGLN